MMWPCFKTKQVYYEEGEYDEEQEMEEGEWDEQEEGNEEEWEEEAGEGEEQEQPQDQQEVTPSAPPAE